MRYVRGFSFSEFGLWNQMKPVVRVIPPHFFYFNAYKMTSSFKFISASDLNPGDTILDDILP